MVVFDCWYLLYAWGEGEKVREREREGVIIGKIVIIQRRDFYYEESQAGDLKGGVKGLWFS